MKFRILGPLEVLDEDRPLQLGGRQRALLALLLVHLNEPVTTDRIADALWGEGPPAGAAKNVQVYVSRLRRALGDDALELLVTRPSGYELKLDPSCVDARRFEALVGEGGDELAAGHPKAAKGRLEEALALWRGAPLGDLAYECFAQPEIARLEELRLVAIEELNDARLALAGHRELAGELEALVAAHPYRERLRAQLMLALYRSERQADALQAYQDARRALVHGLGIEPGEALRELERAILTQDPALALAAHEPSRRRIAPPPNRTLGRATDVDAVAELVRGGDSRLVTITGPGGVGKTRLALEVARALEPEFDDGVWFVSLAATTRVDHVPTAVVQALAIPTRRDADPAERVVRYLASKRALLVLDNLEHLIAAAPWVGNLLAACPGVTLLTTSREALRLQAEHRYELDPLEVPVSRDPAEVAAAPAAALFLARARSQGGHIELDSAAAAAVAEICGRLDGLPLALELAAARSSLLGLAELCDRLGRAVDVLGSGSRDLPDRQRTLRATIEWSHDLLVPPEREAFARFAVFAGGASVATAEEVTGAGLDTLGALVDKNLLLRRDGPGGQSRLAMLETVREFAAERLEASDDAGALRALHCRHYLGLAERADPELYTQRESEWLPRLDAEVENLRAALAWGIEHAPADALRLAGALSTYWSRRNLLDDWAEWNEAALRAAGPAAPAAVRANALLGQAWHMTSAGSLFDRTRAARTRELAASALALFQEASDPSGSGWALIALSWSLYNEPLPHDDRLALVDDALGCAELSDDPRLRAMCLAERAIATPPRRAEEPIAAAARALREVGDIWTLSTLYWYGAHAAIRTGAPELAAGLIERALSHAPELDDPHEMTAEPPLEGYLALFLDDDEHAQRVFEDQLRFCQARAIVYLAPPSLAGLAALAARRGDDERGAQLLGAAESIGPVETVEVLAQLEGRFFAPARKRLGEASWARALADGAELGLDDALGLADAPRRSHGAGLNR